MSEIKFAAGVNRSTSTKSLVARGNTQYFPYHSSKFRDCAGLACGIRWVPGGKSRTACGTGTASSATAPR